MSHDDVFNYCEYACAASFASSTLTCHELNSQDFENHENCYRLMYGDLKDVFEREVIHNQHEEENHGTMALMNVMCRNVDIDCAYATRRYSVGRAEEHECREMCEGQHWAIDFDHHIDPCDHPDDEYSFLKTLFSTAVDNCQAAKWRVSIYQNGIGEDYMDDKTSESDVIGMCNHECGDSFNYGQCNQLKPEDFLNHEACQRIMHGDLKDDYEKEVLDARDGEVRDKMMGVMNVMCGNVEIECAYALFDNFNSIRHGRNIFEEIAEAIPSEEKMKCLEKCDGQMWDQGFDDMVEPCGSSFMNTLSVTIILIISLVR